VFELEQFRDSVLEEKFGVTLLGAKSGPERREGGWKANRELVQYLNS
jgi:hypothetical protein